ncbi:MAG: hypothetical protein KGI78_01070 [Patescibacteria group bacterium]|nr:hypothetical protein [Patescibacteria group bacterium]MDE1943889.1 hypothetical protein [Patescibacteria group bacterium]MDE1945180.1 hypothetical protein [Patescibacteria group bacterium]MDE2057427.1 hypothetical protein [Patescibacteria group bacterium]
MNSNARLILVTAIIAAALVGGFFLLTPHAREVRVASPSPAATASATPAITFKDAFKKGVHTFSGTVEAPDACASVSAAASVATSTDNPRIILDLSMPATEGLCLELPTPVSFSTTFAASSSLPIEVRVNGALATTTP